MHSRFGHTSMAKKRQSCVSLSRAISLCASFKEKSGMCLLRRSKTCERVSTVQIVTCDY